MRNPVIAVIVGLICLLWGTAPANAVTVNTELLLLVDVSGSIDTSEFNLQRTGYANAFLDPAVQALIAANPGGIAASLVYWSSSNQQQIAVGWTHLVDAASATAFANSISTATRPYNDLTAVQSALNFGYQQFINNGYEGNKLIIDISGDGVDNDSPAGLLPTGGRSAALLAGVTTINGLVIGPVGGSVYNYYQSNVIGGTNPMLFSATNFSVFDTAIREKIFAEVGGVPEPGTYAMLGFGLLALGFARRYRKG
jgi:hypothetical protein